MITKFSGDGLFLTSDSHWNHSRILKFCNRPFNTIDEHDKALIDNWNSVVGMDDTVIHLGDFCFGGAPAWRKVREQLNGHIYLIKGNHDDCNMNASIEKLFEDVLYQARIIVDGQTVYLNHFPFLCYAHSDPKLYKDYYINLFGHVHSYPGATGTDISRLINLYPTQYDVGVDNNNFTPISWEDVKQKINNQVNQYLQNA